MSEHQTYPWRVRKAFKIRRRTISIKLINTFQIRLFLLLVFIKLSSFFFLFLFLLKIQPVVIANCNWIISQK